MRNDICVRPISISKSCFAPQGDSALKMTQKYLRAKVFPSCEECVADHFRGLHELIDANGYLEWDFVRSSVAGEIDI